MDQVDILMGTYNGEKYLAEQIHSILSQSYPHIHLIIRDDGSTDATRQILDQIQAQFPERITIMKTTQRLGVKSNFSTLMQHSKAKYVMLSDQDDFWKPSKVEITLTKMKELEFSHSSETPLLVYTDLHVVVEHLKPINVSFWQYSRLDPSRNQLNQLLVTNVVTGCTVMMNRALVTLALPIPPDCLIHDRWIALVAAACGQMSFVAEPTLFYRQHHKNAIGANNRGLLSLLCKFRDSFNKPISFPKLLQAEILLERHGLYIEERKRIILQKYIDLTSQSYIKRRYSMIKNDFLTHGLFWNLALICQGTPHR